MTIKLLEDVQLTTSPCYFPQLREESSTHGESRSIDVPAQAMSQTRSFCDETGVAVSTMLRVAWALVLRAFTGQDSVCFGYHDTNEDTGDLLICHIDLDHTMAISEVLARTQEDNLTFIRHSDTPVFNTCILFERNDGNLSLSENYDIVIQCKVQDNATDAALKYRSSILSHQQAIGIAHTFGQAAAGLIRQNGGDLGQICLLSDWERRQIYTWNQEAPSQGSHCIHELIQERCLAQPMAPAVCAWDGDFTYQELDNLSSVLAVHLTGLGVGPETFVPICFEKSRWITVAIVGVMKAGGAFLLLDPGHPPARLQHICRDVSARLVVVSTQNSVMAADLGAQTVVILGDGEATWRGTEPSTMSPLSSSSVTPENAIYAVFTSGSTGTPKGVVIEHACFYSAISPYSQALQLGPESRVFQFSSYAFDVTIFDTLITLIVGGCVCVPSDTDRWSDTTNAIQRFRANHASLTPTVARILNPAELPSLKTLALGGEKLVATDVDRWADYVRVINLYGASECPIMSIHSKPRSKCSNCRDISYPTGNTCWIVDLHDHEKLLPIGAVGELLIEGPIVGRGYLNDPEKTAATFLQPPVWLRQFRGSKSDNTSSGRVYKAGDLVQYTAKGSIRFVGRKDTQVKLRGQRIELSEVEHHLRQYFPGALDIVAEVVTPTEGGRSPMLVAFIGYDSPSIDQETVSTGVALAEQTDFFRTTVQKARSQLEKSVPSYMVPAILIPLTSIPLTKTGKTDRRRLREWAAELPREKFEMLFGGDSQKRCPSTEIERLVQRYFSLVLNLSLEQIGADDHFFRRGGDSLTAMKMVAMARKDGHHMTVQDVFQHPQLSTLASIVRSEKEITDASSLSTSEPFSLLKRDENILSIIEAAAKQCQVPTASIEDIYPCTPLQEGFMTLTMQEDVEASFVAEIIFAVPPQVNLQQLEAAWNTVADANPILRTRIILSNRYGLVQVVTREKVLWNTTIRQDLRMGVGTPLVQFLVCPLQGDGAQGESQYQLQVSIHHVLYDGWALPLVLAQVEKAYYGEKLSSSPFSPFIRYLQSLEGQEAYWQSYLSNLNASIFPPLPSNTYQPVPKAVLELREIIPPPTAKEFTQNTYLRLAWAITQAKYQKSNDVFYGTVLSGRNAPVAGIESLTAPTVTTTPCRIAFDDLNASVKDVLEKVQKEAMTGIPFELTGLQNIRRFGPEAALACSFQTLLVFQPSGEKNSASFSLLEQIKPISDHQAWTTYAITLICSFDDDMLETTAVFDSNVIKEREMQDILAHLGHVLRTIYSNPATTVIRDILALSSDTALDDRNFRNADLDDDESIVTFPPLPSACFQPCPSASFTRNSKLNPVCQSEISTEVLILAAWGMLQARYVDCSETVFGYHWSGQGTVPFKTLVEKSLRTRDYLHSIQRRYAAMVPHRSDKLQGIASKLQTLIAIHHENSFGVYPHHGTSVAMILDFTIRADSLLIHAQVDENVLSPNQVLRMILQFEHILSQLNNTEHSITLLSELELISPEDKHDILQWQQNIPDRVEQTVHQLIHEQVSSHRDSPAVCSWEGEMTYAQLDSISSKLAGYLMELGVGPETFTPLCFEKSLWTVVAILAVLKAGGAFVPIDETIPQSRMRMMIKEVRAEIVLCSREQYGRYPDLAPTSIIIDGPGVEHLTANRPMKESLTVTPNNVAYVLFTSGSTGTPKGVVIEHGALCTGAFAHKEGLQMKSRVLQFSSYAFDVCIAEIISTLVHGGCICVPSETERQGDIAGAMERMKVNYAFLTPSFANTIDPSTVPTLETLSLAGEAMSYSHIETWAPKVHLVNGYGPTECCVFSAANRRVTLETHPANMGTAVGGACWVVEPDNDQKLAPVGAVGELLIEGHTLARCYLNRPEITAASFIHRPAWLPFNRCDRLYKTGDLVQYMPDGSIHFIGRKDNQVKIRGQRVELGEVEHQVISAADGDISLAVVAYPKAGIFSHQLSVIVQLTKSDYPEQTVLVPVSNSGLQLMGFDPTILSQRVSKEVPDHMVPTVWIVVGKLPISLSGKMDRKMVHSWLAQLPWDFQPAIGGAIRNTSEFPVLVPNEAVAIEISNKIAELVSRGDQAMRVALEGREYTIAASGLDSIQVISLNGFLKETYHASISVRRILDGKTTVRSLAALVTGNGNEEVNGRSSTEPVDVMKEMSRLVNSILPDSRPLPGETVFVTGVTGFLGSQILRQVCDWPGVSKVIVHVRALSAADAWARCRDAAVRTGWWTKSYATKIEAWAGDLAMPRLGLTHEQWAILTTTVNVIIHAGAAVNWNAGYEVLRAANVDSTVDLVCAALTSPVQPRLVYISGGLAWDVKETDESLAAQVARSNGYSQSKAVAEMVVKHFARQSANKGQFSIIKPGLIIGTPEEGISNTDDYLWRLTAASVDIQSFSADDAWLWITSSARVAEETIKSAFCSAVDDRTIVYITDGIRVSEFWDVLHKDLGYPLVPMEHDEWVSKMQQSINDRTSDHSLWPVKEVFEEVQGRFGIQPLVDVDVTHRAAHVRAAIRKSVEFLVEVGFMANATGSRGTYMPDKVFGRTGNVWRVKEMDAKGYLLDSSQLEA